MDALSHQPNLREGKPPSLMNLPPPHTDFTTHSKSLPKPIHSPLITHTSSTNRTTDTLPNFLPTPAHIPPKLRIFSLPFQHGHPQTNKMILQYAQLNKIKQKKSKLHNVKAKKNSATSYAQYPLSTNSAINLRPNSCPHCSDYKQSVSHVDILGTLHPLLQTHLSSQTLESEPAQAIGIAAH